MWDGLRARGSGCGSPRRGADEHIAAMVAELPLHFAAADKLQFKSNVGSGEVFGMDRVTLSAAVGDRRSSRLWSGRLRCACSRERPECRKWGCFQAGVVGLEGRPEGLPHEESRLARRPQQAKACSTMDRPGGLSH